MKKRIWLTMVLCALFIGISGVTVSAEEKEFGYKDVQGGVEITSYRGQNIPAKLRLEPIKSRFPCIAAVCRIIPSIAFTLK